MKNLIAALGLLLFLTSFNFLAPNHKIPLSEQAVNGLMNKSSEYLSKKYKMSPCGITVGMPGGVVKFLRLAFEVCGPLSKEELRKILILSSKDFLELINKDENLKKYLIHYPFMQENVEIALFLHDKNRNGIDLPDIGIAYIKNNKIHYKTLISDDIPPIKGGEFETLDDALKILKQETKE